MRARALGATLSLLAAVACETLPVDRHSPAPLNACPANPCAALDGGSQPACEGGMCMAADALPPLYVVVGLPTYSQLGPSMTFLLTAGGAPGTSPLCPSSLHTCDEQMTCALPSWVIQTDSYTVAPSVSQAADFYLGNMSATTLPSSATFRLLIGPNLDDALDLGLPVVPYAAEHFPTSSPFSPGPFNTAPFAFDEAVPPGCYRRTVQPYAPLSAAFPPEIKLWPPGSPFGGLTAFDPTSDEIGTLPFPTFDLSRPEGLDGWTAYLRNVKTGQVTSTVASLHGSLDLGVRLPTNHGGDVGVTLPGKAPEALTGLELILEPPPGTPLPREVLAPIGGELARAETYPSLPPPLQVTGRVQTMDGLPVPAVISFAAVDILSRNNILFPGSSFEFTTTAATATDPRTGASTYSVVLPRGDYQMVVRPTDGASGMSFSVRPFLSPADATGGGDAKVAPLARVHGGATLADGRLLAEGLVEALPAACPQPMPGPPANPPATDSLCLPQAAQVLAGDDGTFFLALDPGSYTLRVTPVPGTRFPWVTQPLLVQTDDIKLPPIAIPAPEVFSRTVAAADTGAAINAVVRVFTQGSPPVELGRAITDVNGHFDVYLAPQPPPAPPAPSSSPSPSPVP